jgi:hypothetical protein
MSLLEDCVEFLAIIAIASTVKSPFSMLVINHGETCQAKAALLVILGSAVATNGCHMDPNGEHGLTRIDSGQYKLRYA